ncbi:MAG: protein kinase [Planctomycetes bacterium]|nr:protein kinase [Planctomycetota bacterium]
MDCKTEEEIYGYSLDSEEGVKDPDFEKHLKSCQKCRDILHELNDFNGQMNEMSPDTASLKGDTTTLSSVNELVKIGPYKVIKKISSGGMGRVYEGFDTTLKRQVAIKVIRERLSEQDEFRERFLTEARILAQMNYPGIVSIYSAGEEDKRLYLVMEYVDGLTLQESCMKNRQQALETFDHILAAVSEAHEKGILHRDLKPSNIMVTKEGVVKVLDFGISCSSRFSSGHTQAGQIVGTMSYLAPEILNGGSYSTHSDIYSLGILFFHLLSGQAPASTRESLKERKEGTKAPAEMGYALPGEPELQKYMDRFLLPRPNERYPSAEDARKALQPFLGYHSEKKTPSPSVVKDTLFSEQEAAKVISRAAQIQRDRDQSLKREELEKAASELGVKSEGVLSEAISEENKQKKIKIMKKILLASVAIVLCLALISYLMNRPSINEGNENNLKQGMKTIGLINQQKSVQAASSQGKNLNANQATHTPQPKLISFYPNIAKVRVAVLPFVNGSDDSSWDGLAASCADSLLLPLSKVEDITLLERMQLEQVLKEIDFNQSRYVDPAFAIEMGKVAGVDATITGTLQKMKNQVRIMAKVISSETGKVLYSETIEGQADDLFNLQDKLGASLASKL